MSESTNLLVYVEFTTKIGIHVVYKKIGFPLWYPKFIEKDKINTSLVRLVSFVFLLRKKMCVSFKKFRNDIQVAYYDFMEEESDMYSKRKQYTR